MRLGLQRAALAKLLAHPAYRRHAEAGKLCDLSRVLALLVKFKNALPQGDGYGSHAPTLPHALAFCKLHYLWKCSSRWIGQQAVSVRLLSSEHAARYLRFRARHVQIHRGDAAALGQFVGLLRRQGVVPAEKTPSRRLTPIEQAVDRFARYLRNERLLSEAAVVNYVPFVRRFLADRFGDRPVRLSRLCAGDIVRLDRKSTRLN